MSKAGIVEPAAKIAKVDQGTEATMTTMNGAAGDGAAEAKDLVPTADLKKLENFVFKEVLGSLPEKKSIFIHCHNTVEDKPAILILNKIAFSEDKDALQNCIDELRLIHISNNDIYGNYSVELPPKYNLHKSQLIYPATEKHINKYRFMPLYQVFETPDDYKKLTLPYIESSQMSVEWVYNILDGKKEQELILYKDENPETGFVLLKDIKWDGETLEQLYYQVIINRRDIKSIRDLTPKELPLLENILKTSTKAIHDKHGIPESRLKIHFHYQPSYYHLHVHIRAMGSESDQPFVWLKSTIENIKLMPDYYQKATLSCILKEGHPLYRSYKEAGRV